MAAPLMEWLRWTVEITISARLATAEMIVFGVPQALLKLLGQISLYSFVLPFRLAFVVYSITKSSREDARGSLKPEEPGVPTRQRRFSSIKFASSVLCEFISLLNEDDTAFDTNMTFSRSRSSTTSSEMGKHSSSNTSVATLVEIGPLKEIANAYPKTPAITNKYGITILPDSQWATMNPTQSRRTRRAIKRVKYKEEHGVPPREVNGKASKASKTSKINKENTKENDREHELEISEENVKDNDKESQTKDGEKDDQEPVKEKYNEGIKDDDTENNDQGFVEGFTIDGKGVEEDVTKYDKEGVEDDFTKDDEGVKGCTTEDDNEGVEAYVTGDNEDVKKNITKDDDAGEVNVTEVDNERVEGNVTEDVYKRIEEDVPEEHDEVVNKDGNEGYKKTAAYGAHKFTPPTHHRTLLQRSRVNVIPSLVKGWPPVLLSESIIDRLDPIDVKIMQLECEYHLSRQQLA